MKIFVSLTTIPSRVGSIDRCINSLLNQTIKPDKIFINIPVKYKRFDQLINENDIPRFADKTVKIVRCDDYGPGTKLLGSLHSFEKNALLVLVDDDCTYKDYMIETFVKEIGEAKKISCSYYVFNIKGEKNHKIGQGADGFAIRTDTLDKIKIYHEIIKENQYLFFHDDLWISYYLYLRDTKIVSMVPYIRETGELIYEIYNDKDGLIGLKNKFNRHNLNLQGAKYLEEKEKLLKVFVKYMPAQLANLFIPVIRLLRRKDQKP